MPITITSTTISETTEAIRALFLADEIPWIIGYSGGKDSTATLQLVWMAITALQPEQRTHKRIHVISTDTLVEQPVVSSWVSKSLRLMNEAATRDGLSIVAHRLTPKTSDSFWVNLIGRGYPAPRQGFRWCTSRLKIEPSNTFIMDMTNAHGESILVLGTRKAESAARARTMARYEAKRTKEWLSPNGSLPNSWVFTPIEDWTGHDVWFYLMQFENPWGCSNKELLTMYRGASQDAECPLQVDTSGPSCGNSRFGCWVCTLVSSDRSMEAMIQNDEEKEWMIPLLEFRNYIANVDDNGRIDDRHRRDYRRMDGGTKLVNDRLVHGPYLRAVRHEFLRQLLEIQESLKNSRLDHVRDVSLITDGELREIRRIWVIDKHEFEDALPSIYAQVTGREYPFLGDLSPGPFGQAEWELLEALCGDDYVFLELLSSLLHLEHTLKGDAHRRDILSELEHALRRCLYKNEEDAEDWARRRLLHGRVEPERLPAEDDMMEEELAIE